MSLTKARCNKAHKQSSDEHNNNFVISDQSIQYWKKAEHTEIELGMIIVLKFLHIRDLAVPTSLTYRGNLELFLRIDFELILRISSSC